MSKCDSCRKRRATESLALVNNRQLCPACARRALYDTQKPLKCGVCGLFHAGLHVNFRRFTDET